MARGVKLDLLRFVRTYLVFMVFAVLLNLSMEVVFGPENRQALLEYGWLYLVQYRLLAILQFYLVFNLVGTLIFLRSGFGSRRMGILSWVVGFVLELAVMRPDWVLDIYALRVSGGLLVTVLISSFYWFAAWGVPSRFVSRS